MKEFILSFLPDETAADYSQLSNNEFWVTIGIYLIVLLLMTAVYILIFVFLMKMNKKLFSYIKKKKGNSVSFQFLEKLVALALIVYFVVLPLGGDQLAQSLLGSATVIAAIVGLAASDVIKDMCAGLQISVYKPFDVGSRIQLDDGRAGIVEKLTLRHVVLRLIDTTRLIVPNSKINQMGLTNFSYEEEVPRAIELHFPISYTSDVEKAKKIIRETICSCKTTLNEDTYNAEDPNSKSVYFLELSGSALIMGATVYYPHKFRTEVVKDEVNSRVFAELTRHGIEIPYEYVNVVMNQK